MNLLIRDLPDDVLAALDREAERLGLSRSEYVRRVLTAASRGTGNRVTVEDLTRLTETFGDLSDPDLMGRAWQ